MIPVTEFRETVHKLLEAIVIAEDPASSREQRIAALTPLEMKLREWLERVKHLR